MAARKGGELFLQISFFNSLNLVLGSLYMVYIQEVVSVVQKMRRESRLTGGSVSWNGKHGCVYLIML